MGFLLRGMRVIVSVFGHGWHSDRVRKRWIGVRAKPCGWVVQLPLLGKWRVIGQG